MNTDTVQKPHKKNQWRVLYLHLTQMIQNGDYPAGTALPSIPTLVEEHNLTRGVVQKAVVELEKNGFIIRRHGAGCYVLPPKELQLDDHQQSASQVLQDAISACRVSGMTRREIDFVVDSALTHKET